MEMILERFYLDEHCTRGVLRIPEKGLKFVTLESKDVMLTKSTNLSAIESYRQNGPVAIPRGEYVVDLYASKKFGGVRPILLNVPGFECVLIREGNYVRQSKGCILVSKTFSGNALWHSMLAVNEVIAAIREAKQKLMPVKLLIRYSSESRAYEETI